MTIKITNSRTLEKTSSSTALSARIMIPIPRGKQVRRTARRERRAIPLNVAGSETVAERAGNVTAMMMLGKNARDADDAIGDRIPSDNCVAGHQRQLQDVRLLIARVARPQVRDTVPPLHDAAPGGPLESERQARKAEHHTSGQSQADRPR